MQVSHGFGQQEVKEGASNPDNCTAEMGNNLSWRPPTPSGAIRTTCRVALLTQSCIPLLQELHLHQLVGRGGIFKPVDQGIDQAFVVPWKDAQVVPGQVLQLLVPVGVEAQENGRATARRQSRTCFGDILQGAVELCSREMLVANPNPGVPLSLSPESPQGAGKDTAAPTSPCH